MMKAVNKETFCPGHRGSDWPQQCRWIRVVSKVQSKKKELTKKELPRDVWEDPS